MNLRIFFLRDVFGNDVADEIAGCGRQVAASHRRFFIFRTHKIARRLTNENEIVQMKRCRLAEFACHGNKCKNNKHRAADEILFHTNQPVAADVVSFGSSKRLLHLH
ncbi:MAG TPA: hypothetical protein VHQ01_06405, partial [Pyrinomonadaceae bacterium]|nr:hypothetical protein [Pyrinomonadaceae bacterium]